LDRETGKERRKHRLVAFSLPNLCKKEDRERGRGEKKGISSQILGFNPLPGRGGCGKKAESVGPQNKKGTRTEALP